MIKQNYAFEKRQKEIAKKQKKQEKLLHKTAAHDARTEQATPADDDTATPKPAETGNNR